MKIALKIVAGVLLFSSTGDIVDMNDITNNNEGVSIEGDLLDLASEAGIVEKTVKVHRARVMEKMRAGSLAELVRLADRAGIVPKR